LQVEEMLIALVTPVMCVYRLKGGQLGYKGHCMSLAQDVKPVLDGVLKLPRRLEDVPIVVFRRQYSARDPGADQMRARNFRVRRQAVLAWLHFLLEKHRDYQALHVEIDEQAVEVSLKWCIKLCSSARALGTLMCFWFDVSPAWLTQWACVHAPPPASGCTAYTSSATRLVDVHQYSSC
jgi:hypothetical protein